jgi:hypothetical protein
LIFFKFALFAGIIDSDMVTRLGAFLQSVIVRTTIETTASIIYNLQAPENLKGRNIKNQQGI